LLNSVGLFASIGLFCLCPFDPFSSFILYNMLQLNYRDEQM
jgi:hypothetical protein